MKTSNKSKLITLILTALTVVSVLLGAFILAFPKKPIEAVNNYITISKVNRLVKKEGTPESFYKTENGVKGYNYFQPIDNPLTKEVNEAEEFYKTNFGENGYSSAYYNAAHYYYLPVKDYFTGDFVMLNNTNLEVQNAGNATYYLAENLLIDFSHPTLKFKISSISLKLNGKDLYTGSNYTADWHDNDQRYAYLIDFNDLYNLNKNNPQQKGTRIEPKDVFGNLEITIVYNIVSGSTTQGQATDTTNVYLINEDSYVAHLEGIYGDKEITSYEQLTTETLLSYMNSNKDTWEDFIPNPDENNVYEYIVGTNGGQYQELQFNGSPLTIDNRNNQNVINIFNGDFFTPVTYIANNNYNFNIYGYNQTNLTVQNVVENKLYETDTYYALYKDNSGQYVYEKITNNDKVFKETTTNEITTYQYTNSYLDKTSYTFKLGQSTVNELFEEYNFLENFGNGKTQSHDIYLKGEGDIFTLVDPSDTYELFDAAKTRKNIFWLNTTEVKFTEDPTPADNSDNSNVLFETASLHDGKDFVFYKTYDESDESSETYSNFIKYGKNTIHNYFKELKDETMVENLFKKGTNSSTINGSTIALYVYNTDGAKSGTYTKINDTNVNLGWLYVNGNYSHTTENTDGKYYVSLIDMAAEKTPTGATNNNSATYKTKYFCGNYQLYLQSLNNIAGGIEENKSDYFNYFLNENNFDNTKITAIGSNIYTYNSADGSFEAFKANKVDSYFKPITAATDIVSSNGLYKNSTNKKSLLENNMVKIFEYNGTNYSITSETNIAKENNIFDIYNLYDSSNDNYFTEITDITTFNQCLGKRYIKSGNDYVPYPGAYTSGTTYYTPKYYYCILDNELRSTLRNVYFVGNADNANLLNDKLENNSLFHSLIENSSGTYFANKLQTSNADATKFYKSILDNNTLYFKTKDTVLTYTETNTITSAAFNEYSVLKEIYTANNKTLTSYENTLPILTNTEKVYYQNNVNNTEVNYFNYSNTDTLNYFGGATNYTNGLQYPTYVYDATKYNLSYKYIVNNEVVETVTSSIVFENGKAILRFEHNNKLNGITFVDYEDFSPTTCPIVELTFNKIGIYDFTINFVTKCSVFNTKTNSYEEMYLIDDSTANEEQLKYLHATRLYIYGYQLYYTNYAVSDSNNNTTLSEFKNGDQTADYSNNIDKIVSEFKTVDGYNGSSLEKLTEKVNNLINTYGSNISFYYVYEHDGIIDYVEVPVFEQLDASKYYNLSDGLKEKIYWLNDTNYIEIDTSEGFANDKEYYKMEFKAVDPETILVETVDNQEYQSFASGVNASGKELYFTNGLKPLTTVGENGVFKLVYEDANNNYIAPTVGTTPNANLQGITSRKQFSVGDLLTDINTTSTTDKYIYNGSNIIRADVVKTQKPTFIGGLSLNTLSAYTLNDVNENDVKETTFNGVYTLNNGELTTKEDIESNIANGVYYKFDKFDKFGNSIENPKSLLEVLKALNIQYPVFKNINIETDFDLENIYKNDTAHTKLTDTSTILSLTNWENIYILNSDYTLTQKNGLTLQEIKEGLTAATPIYNYETTTFVNTSTLGAVQFNTLTEVFSKLYYSETGDINNLTQFDNSNWDTNKDKTIYYKADAGSNAVKIETLADLSNQYGTNYYLNGTDNTFTNLSEVSTNSMLTTTQLTSTNSITLKDLLNTCCYIDSYSIFNDTTNPITDADFTETLWIGVKDHLTYSGNSASTTQLSAFTTKFYRIRKNGDTASFENELALKELTITDKFSTTNDNSKFNVYYTYRTLQNGIFSKNTYFDVGSDSKINTYSKEQVFQNFLTGNPTIYETSVESVSDCLFATKNGDNARYTLQTTVNTGTTYYAIRINTSLEIKELWGLNGDHFELYNNAPTYSELAYATKTIKDEPYYYYDDTNYYHFNNILYLSPKTYYTLTFCKQVLQLANGDSVYKSTSTVRDNYNDVTATYYMLVGEPGKVYTAQKIVNANGGYLYNYSPVTQYAENQEYFFAEQSGAEIEREDYFNTDNSSIFDYVYINVNKNNILDLIKAGLIFEEGSPINEDNWNDDPRLEQYQLTDGANYIDIVNANSSFIKINNYAGQNNNYYYYNYLANLVNFNGGGKLPRTLYYTIKNSLEETVLNTSVGFTDAQGYIKNAVRATVKNASGNGLNSDIIKVDDIVRTNQAPISTNFYANLVYGQTNSTQNSENGYVYVYSFYDYFKTKNDLENYNPSNAEGYVFTNSTTFKENGYYVVYVLYTFDNYSYYNGTKLVNSAEGANKKLNIQMFVFENRKSQPNISTYENGNYILIETKEQFDNLLKREMVFENLDGVYTNVTPTDFIANTYYTLKTLPTGSYSNKGLIIKFNEDASVFNIHPYVKVTVEEASVNSSISKGYTKIYASKQIADALGLTANAFKYDHNFTIDLNLEANKETYVKYKVEIFYGTNWTSSTTRYYTLDNQSIENITANQVKVNTYTYPTNPNKTISDYVLTNNQLGTKFTTAYYNDMGALQTDGFVINWATKGSGSKITANYKFVKLEKDNSLKANYSVINDGSIKLFKNGTPVQQISNHYIKNGYKLSSVSNTLPYTDSGYYFNNGTNFNSLDYSITGTEFLLGYVQIPANECTWESENYYYKDGDNYKPITRADYLNNPDKPIYKYNINSFLNDSGLYIFTLTDSAGNEATKVFFLDNSAPTVLYSGINGNKQTDLSDISDESQDPIISEDLFTLWGKGKQIDVNINSITYTEIANGAAWNFSTTTYYYDTENEQYTKINQDEYNAIHGDKPKIFTKNISETELSFINDFLNNQNYINIDVESVNWSFEHISNGSTSSKALTDFANGYNIQKLERVNGEFLLEGYHTFKVNYSITKNELNRSDFVRVSDPTFTIFLNTDNSKLTIYTIDDATSINSAYFKNLKQNYATNRNAVVLTWQDSAEKNVTPNPTYLVESVTYDFFAFTFDKNNVNYPFADTVSNLTVEEKTLYSMDSQENENIYNITGNKYTTKALNLSSSLTREGVYIITRTYTDDSVPDGSNDTKVRTYYFYVDRYGIIYNLEDSITVQNNQPTFIGELINLLLSVSTNDSKYLGSIWGEDILTSPFVNEDFAKDNQSEFFITTNKLPIVSLILSNKYVEKSALLELVNYLNNSGNNIPDASVNNIYYRVVTDTNGNPATVNYDPLRDTANVDEYTITYHKVNGFTENELILDDETKISVDEKTLRNVYKLKDNTANNSLTDSDVMPFMNTYNSQNFTGSLLFKNNKGEYEYINGYNYNDKFNLKYTLYKYNTIEGFKEITNFANESLSKKIQEPGTYKLVVNDISGYDNKRGAQILATNVDANKLIFYFKINTDKPDADIVKIIKDSEQLLTENNNTVKTNSKGLKLVWNLNSEYMAQISQEVIKIKLEANNGDYLELTYNAKENSVSSIKSNINAININSNNLHELFKFDKSPHIGDSTQNRWDKDWDFEVELFTTDNTIFNLSYYKTNQIDVKVYITNQFEGEENYFNYIDENGKEVNFFTNTLTLDLDYTAPTQIYESLKNSDSYFSSLNNDQQANFEKYDSLISYDNYSFTKMIENGNTISFTSNESRDIYYRQYNKYSTTDTFDGLQSLVENDPRFDMANVETARIRYVEGAHPDKFDKATKEGNNFNLVVDANNYYEVVEIDEAGNYKIYSVYAITDTNSFKLETSYKNNNINMNSSLQIGGSNPKTNVQISTADSNFKFTSISQITQTKNYDWVDIVVTNNTTKKTTNLSYMPNYDANKNTYKTGVEYFTNTIELISKLNELCTYSDTNKGNSYTIKVYTSLGTGTINLSFKGESLNFESMFTKNNNSITLSFDASKHTTYLEKIIITKYKNAQEADSAEISVKHSEETNLLEASFVRDIHKNETNFVQIDNFDPNKITISIIGGEDGDYWFEAYDNFGESYEVQQFIGTVNLNEFTVNGDFVQYTKNIKTTNNNNKEYTYKEVYVYYTGAVSYKFEPRIYTASFVETLIEQDANTHRFTFGNTNTYTKDNSNNYNDIYKNGICTYLANPNSNMVIEVENNKGNLAYRYVFVYYPIVQNVHLSSFTGDPLNNLMYPSEDSKNNYQITSKFITIDYKTNNNKPVFVDINGDTLNDGSIYDQSNTSKDTLATYDYIYSNGKFITQQNEGPIANTLVEITYKNADGVSITYLAQDGTQLKECGLYDIKIYNSVGFVYKTYKVELIETVNSYYSVISNNKVLSGFNLVDNGNNTISITNKSINGTNYSINSNVLYKNGEYVKDIDNFTIYYAANNAYNIEVNSDSSKGIEYKLIHTDTDNNYNVYILYSTVLPTESLPLFFVVASLNHSGKPSYHANNIEFREPSQENPDEFHKIFATTTLLSTYDKYIDIKISANYGGTGIYQYNYINIDLYYNDEFVNTLNYLTKGVAGFEYDADNKVYNLTLTESGRYKLKIYDQTGTISYFLDEKNNPYEYLTIDVENNVLFNINGKTPINNAVFNSAVSLSLLKTTVYNTLTVDLTATLNNVNYKYGINTSTHTYTFSDFGVYTIKMTYSDNNREFTTTYTFTIINTKEATHTYSYLAPNGYEIVKVEKLQGETYTDVTSYYSSTSVNLTYDFDTTIQTYNGAGKYRITVEKYATSLTPNGIFTFDVWINSAKPYVKVNVKDGETTRKEVQITLDINSIYKELGECTVIVNGKGGTEVEINEELIKKYTTNDGKVKNYVISVEKPDSYNVKIVTDSGNTLYVYNFTKKNTLNTMAIILIIVAVAVVGVVIFLFFKMRKKMTVR